MGLNLDKLMELLQLCIAQSPDNVLQAHTGVAGDVDAAGDPVPVGATALINPDTGQIYCLNKGDVEIATEAGSFEAADGSTVNYVAGTRIITLDNGETFHVPPAATDPVFAPGEVYPSDAPTTDSDGNPILLNADGTVPDGTTIYWSGIPGADAMCVRKPLIDQAKLDKLFNAIECSQFGTCFTRCDGSTINQTRSFREIQMGPTDDALPPQVAGGGPGQIAFSCGTIPPFKCNTTVKFKSVHSIEFEPADDGSFPEGSLTTSVTFSIDGGATYLGASRGGVDVGSIEYINGMTPNIARLCEIEFYNWRVTPALSAGVATDVCFAVNVENNQIDSGAADLNRASATFEWIQDNCC